MVDPLVSGTTTLSGSGVGSMYNSSCTYTNACTYSITVPTPAGTTFTDVLWTMGFTATNPCGMTNAWFTITSSTCISPFVGGAWTCLVSGPGTCAGENMPAGLILAPVFLPLLAPLRM